MAGSIMSHESLISHCLQMTARVSLYLLTFLLQLFGYRRTQLYAPPSSHFFAMEFDSISTG